jgi:transposase
MIRLFTREGKEIKELALMFGVSTRTVQRALSKTLIKGDRMRDE